MQHGSDIVVIERTRERIDVPDIRSDEGSPSHEALVPGREIVDYDRQVACPAQRLAAMRTDITGTACYEDRLHRRLPRLASAGASTIISGRRLKFSLCRDLLEIRDRLWQSLRQRNAGTPIKGALRGANVGTALFRIVLRQR